jgi:hypothetical protein
MTHFLRNGSSFRIANEENMDIHDRLPAGNYTIQQDQFGNLFLDKIDSFNITGKLYGDIDNRASRILSTFENRTASTGVLLTGEPGSGKSLLAKLLCYRASQANIPSIIISQPWHGEKFNSFLQSINHECVVLFDEFEKVYDSEKQESLLTLLDGVFPSKKLFVLTCNDKYRIDKHMRNRPGRIFYTLDYKGLDDAFIREYCEDNLNQKHYADQICNIAAMFSAFNFDMLKALVEEMNRYNESPDQSLGMLNVKAEYSAETDYIVSVETSGGKIIPQDLLSGDVELTVNPLSLHNYPVELRVQVPGSIATNNNSVEDFYEKEVDDVPSSVSDYQRDAILAFYKELNIDTKTRSAESLCSSGMYINIYISTSGLLSVDSKKGIFVFQGDTGHKVTLRRKPITYTNVHGLLV